MDNASKLTGRQRMVYDFVVEFIKSNGYPPAVRDICAGVRLASPSTAHYHLKALEEKGFIKRDASRNRSITLLLEEEKGIPVLGQVAAGGPILAVEHVEGYIPYQLDTEDEHFALRVKGDSMIDAGILSGDYVVVRRQQTVLNRQIVVALLDEEATVKTFRLVDSLPWLYPENDSYEPIDAREAQILGVVKCVIRNY